MFISYFLSPDEAFNCRLGAAVGFVSVCFPATVKCLSINIYNQGNEY